MLLLEAALRNAGLRSPEEVARVETHGTGTALGDPIEVGALAQLRPPVSRTRPTPVSGTGLRFVFHDELFTSSGFQYLLFIIICFTFYLLGSAGFEH